MRGYAFSLAISVLAFLIGVFSVYLFLLSEPEIRNVAVTELTKDFEVLSVPEDLSLHQQTGIESLISDKEKATLLFGPTLEKWRNKEKIAELVEPSPIIIERIAATRLHRYQAPYLTRMAQKSYKSSLLDLNGDGIAELVVLINCEESDGGDLWIFRAVKGDFEVILHSMEQLEKFEFRKTKSNGFLDLQTSYYPNDPQIETLKSMADYKFDGEKYTLRGCSGIVDRYRDDNGVDLHYLKKPVLQHYDDCC